MTLMVNIKVYKVSQKHGYNQYNDNTTNMHAY